MPNLSTPAPSEVGQLSSEHSGIPCRDLSFNPCPIVDYTPAEGSTDQGSSKIRALHIAELLEEAGCHDGASKWRLIAREHADGVAR